MERFTKSTIFCQSFRFIDNLRATKNHLEFDKNFEDIYPSKLGLRKESILPSEK